MPLWEPTYPTCLKTEINKVVRIPVGDESKRMLWLSRSLQRSANFDSIRNNDVSWNSLELPRYQNIYSGTVRFVLHSSHLYLQKSLKVSTSLLSQVMSSRLARGTYNGGLLSTKLGPWHSGLQMPSDNIGWLLG
ncbi:hypothetical protein HPP92_008383 [Vanilla planifolia]|uniref:Uncharacterized protein n=1 Tax=Vanilla planifolia TaxID=51239 RepID=A0A835R8S0_VANPL|nr:hypothetical protein HPP92_008383 [Vanilla planifolia]